MSRLISDSNSCGFKFESGTWLSSTGLTLESFGLVQTATPDESENIQPLRYLGGGNRNVNMFVNGPRDYTATVSYYPQDWKMLVFALGSNVDASGTATGYVHTISEADSGEGNAFTSGTQSPFMSFTTEFAQQVTSPTGLNNVKTLNGCMVNTQTINFNQGEPLSCDLDIIGGTQTWTSGAATSVTVSTDKPYLWNEVTLSVPSGTAYTSLKTATLTISNNMEAPHYLNGSRDISAPIPLNRDYELTATFDSQGGDVKTFTETYFNAGSEFNTLLRVYKDATHYANITMSGCRMMDMETPSPNEGINEYNLTIQPKSVSAVVRDETEKYNPW